MAYSAIWFVDPDFLILSDPAKSTNKNEDSVIFLPYFLTHLRVIIQWDRLDLSFKSCPFEDRVTSTIFIIS